MTDPRCTGALPKEAPHPHSPQAVGYSSEQNESTALREGGFPFALGPSTFLTPAALATGP